ncbi:MAG: hypothetical protein ACTTHG_05160 [Treponemataceae bacterium]
MKFENYPSFELSAKLDFSFVDSLIPDSFSVFENFAGSCAFGFVFEYKDKDNFYVFLISDKKNFCIYRYSGAKLFSVISWRKLDLCCSKFFIKLIRNENYVVIKINDNRIKNSIKSKSGKNEFKIELFRDDVKVENEQHNVDTLQNSKRIALACQNYDIYEKVVVKYSSICMKKLSKKMVSDIARIPVFEDDLILKKDNRNNDVLKTNTSKNCQDESWAYYEEARKRYINGDIKKAKDFILAAAAELSENLAILELYGFILKEEKDEQRVIKLIQSCKKHAPYVKEYAVHAFDLIERLKKESKDNKEENLKYGEKNRAEYPIEKSFIAGNLYR